MTETDGQTTDYVPAFLSYCEHNLLRSNIL